MKMLAFLKKVISGTKSKEKLIKVNIPTSEKIAVALARIKKSVNSESIKISELETLRDELRFIEQKLETINHNPQNESNNGKQIKKIRSKINKKIENLRLIQEKAVDDHVAEMKEEMLKPVFDNNALKLDEDPSINTQQWSLDLNEMAKQEGALPKTTPKINPRKRKLEKKEIPTREEIQRELKMVRKNFIEIVKSIDASDEESSSKQLGTRELNERLQAKESEIGQLKNLKERFLKIVKAENKKDLLLENDRLTIEYLSRNIEKELKTQDSKAKQLRTELKEKKEKESSANKSNKTSNSKFKWFKFKIISSIKLIIKLSYKKKFSHSNWSDSSSSYFKKAPKQMRSLKEIKADFDNKMNKDMDRTQTLKVLNNLLEDLTNLQKVKANGIAHPSSIVNLRNRILDKIEDIETTGIDNDDVYSENSFTC